MACVDSYAVVKAFRCSPLLIEFAYMLIVSAHLLSSTFVIAAVAHAMLKPLYISRIVQWQSAQSSGVHGEFAGMRRASCVDFAHHGTVQMLCWERHTNVARRWLFVVRTEMAHRSAEWPPSCMPACRV